MIAKTAETIDWGSVQAGRAKFRTLELLGMKGRAVSFCG